MSRDVYVIKRDDGTYWGDGHYVWKRSDARRYDCKAPGIVPMLNERWVKLVPKKRVNGVDRYVIKKEGLYWSFTGFYGSRADAYKFSSKPDCLDSGDRWVKLVPKKKQPAAPSFDVVFDADVTVESRPALQILLNSPGRLYPEERKELLALLGRLVHLEQVEIDANALLAAVVEKAVTT